MSDHSFEKKDDCQISFKKRKPNRKNIRKKIEVSSTDSDEANESAVIHPSSKKKPYNPLIQSSSGFEKARERKINRQKNNNEHSNSESSEEDEILRRSKLFKVSYASSKRSDRDGPNDMGATATTQIDTERENDAQAQFEANKKILDELKEAKDVDNIYRGINRYHNYVQKKDTVLGNASSNHTHHGPMRAPKNIRSTVRWDYQPDICKDYKETGYCGFGDSCKFLHDRSDYKAGWQLEKEFASGKNKDDDSDDDDDDEKYLIKDKY